MEATLSNATALYLYGIVAHPSDLPICDGIEEGTAIEVIACDRVACVVSAVAARDYESSATGRNAVEQLDWVTPRAWRHHDVVRRLHTATTVIPLKFGTLCGSAEGVRDMLSRCSAPIGALLDRFNGRDEWKLTIHADVDRITERLEQDDLELCMLCAEEQTLPSGRAYFVRKRRERRTAALVAQELAAITRLVHDRIDEYVDDYCEENGATPASTLLVARARFSELTTCLAGLEAAQRSNGLALELRGPWAPYSFVNGQSIVGN